MHRNLTLLVLFLASAGCNALKTDSPAPIDDGFTITKGEPLPMGRVDAPPDSPHFLPHGDPRTEAAGREMFFAAVPALGAGSTILASDRSLAEKDEAMRAVFESNLPRDARWFVVTDHGMEMLQLLLAGPSSDPEAIGYYAGLLADYENPNADILSAAFDRLGRTWTQAQLAEARQHVTEGALDWLQESGCASCKTAEGLRAYTEAGADLDARNKKIADAVAGLTTG